MFLKSLALRGFKTFADPTEIEFGQDSKITAVVGPNGCGKSNILDATRWVLGEDNARHLRVAALPDIIFAGTDKRKALSMAEITLVFDNSAGKLPLPFSEVAIKRRTFREGESEFFINKNLCRLKDIKDLLLDTGLGEGTYSIITQGQVDAILSSKGEERRLVFEEAAGINKYKTRKLSAEKKLIAAEQNILRINDLKVEVGEHLISLEEQARRAREYVETQTKVKEAELGLCKKLLGGLLEKKAKLEGELSLARQASAAKVAAEEQDEVTLVTLKGSLRKIELEIEEQLVKLDGEKDRLRDIELNRRFVEGEIKREESLCADLQAKLDALRQKTSALSAAEAAQGNAASSLNELEAVIHDSRELVNQLALICGALGRDNAPKLLEQKEIEATINLKRELLESEYQRSEQELDRTRFGLQAHRSELDAIKPATPSEMAAALSALKAERDKLRLEISELEEKVRREGSAEKAAGDATNALEIALAKLEGEMLGLTEKVAADYSLTVQELDALPYVVANVAKTRTDVEAGKQRLRDLEPVNLMAIEEFERTKERLTFIDAQLIDLNAARENLRNLIIELDQRAEDSFTQTMSQLSSVFSETFAKLFAGGEAKVALAPGTPVLEADIEISVRPAGRKWLPLALLSGGERSLCAIAILFSLLKIRPSPFCFMDEVDAALDEANIGRFTEMLKDFSAATQIIVITHNKRTMAAAANIYGITMEEPGVSKVISMKLSETAI